MKDKLVLRGIVDYKLTNKETGEVISGEEHNNITEAGAMYMAANGLCSVMNSFSGRTFGRLITNEALDCLVDGSYRIRHVDNRSLSVSLVKLGLTGTYGKDTKYLNIRNAADGTIDQTKVVGFASRSVDETANVRQGKMQETISGSPAITNFARGGSCWKFDAGFGTGEFDHAVISPGLEGGPNGVVVYSNIIDSNELYSNYSYKGLHVNPGMTGLTGENEIVYRLIEETSGTSVYKLYNLATNTTTVVDTTNKAAMFLSKLNASTRIGDMLVCNGVLVYTIIENDSIGYSKFRTYLYGYNIAGETMLSNLSLSDRVIGLYPLTSTTLACVTSNFRTDSYSACNTFQVTVSTSGMSKTDISSSITIGNVPSYFTQYNYMKIGSYYFVYDMMYGSYYKVNSSSTENYELRVVMCTDLSDVSGTMCGEFAVKDRVSGFMYNGELVLTTDTMQNNVWPTYDRYSKDGSNKDIQRKGYADGFYLSLGWYSNIVSIVSFGQVLNKTANHILEISYNYELSVEDGNDSVSNLS